MTFGRSFLTWKLTIVRFFGECISWPVGSPEHHNSITTYVIEIQCFLRNVRSRKKAAARTTFSESVRSLAAISNRLTMPARGFHGVVRPSPVLDRPHSGARSFPNGFPGRVLFHFVCVFIGWHFRFSLFKCARCRSHLHSSTLSGVIYSLE